VIDFHTHILPGIDDGSKDVEMSYKMIEMLANQGVDTVIATPHFYYDKISLDRFLKYRNISLELLKKYFEEKNIEKRPEIILGAEVKFFYGLDTFGRAEELCIKGTRYMLIEMPFEKWDIKMYATLARLSVNREIIPVIAHIERYLGFNSFKTIMEKLVEIGALLQANTSFFTSIFTRYKAFSLMKNGLIQFIGTDCHDIDKRKPDYDELLKLFEKKYNGQYINDLKFWEGNFNSSNPERI